MPGLLIFVGIILVILNVLSIKKHNKSFNGVLGNAIENTNDYDIKLGEIRREFSESILELQSELVDMKDIMKKNNIIHKNYEDKHYKDNNKTIIDEPKQVENNKTTIDEASNEIIAEEQININNGNSKKVEEIKRLFSEEYSLDEISEISHLGKGEVLLIKDLYIR